MWKMSRSIQGDLEKNNNKKTWTSWGDQKTSLAGGFKHFSFSPRKLGEDEPILPHIFQINIGSTTNHFSIQTSQAITVSSCHRIEASPPRLFVGTWIRGERTRAAGRRCWMSWIRSNAIGTFATKGEGRDPLKWKDVEKEHETCWRFFVPFFFGTGVVGGKNGIKKRKVFERFTIENYFQQKEDHQPPQLHQVFTCCHRAMLFLPTSHSRCLMCLVDL